MKTAEAFDRNDGGTLEKLGGIANGLGSIDKRAIGRPELQMRATIPAGVRLGVEAAIGRIVVFPLAREAHFEGGHGGARAIVGNVVDDREARAAIGAVDEGIAEAAVARVHHLAKTIGADRYIRRNQSFRRGVETAGHDAEVSVAG